MHSYGYGALGDDPTEQLVPVPPPRRPWWQNTTVLAIGVSFLAAVLIVTIGFIVLKPSKSSNNADAGNTVPLGSSTATATATPSPTPTATPTPTTATPRSAPTTRYIPPDPVVPIPSEKESDTPPVEDPVPLCTSDPGPDEAPSVVQAALAAAGAHAWWGPPDVRPVPNGWPEDKAYPSITIPSDLMYAIAWTESSWHSSAVGCTYHEVGLMQLKPETADWLNGRFGENSDLSTVKGNAELGAMYLEQLTMYFGLYYFGSFDLDTVEPVGDGGTNLRLRDVVIAAYNVGSGGVEDPGGGDTLHIGPIGQNYLGLVLGNLSAKPWQ
jgi:hypothetical protein